MKRQELAAGLAAGDQTAWTVFLRDYGRLIFAVVNRFTGVSEERDDLFQEACLAILKGVGTLRDPDRLTTWVYRTTYRLCVDATRRRRRERGTDSLDVLPSAFALQSPCPLPGDDLVRLEEVATLLDAVDQLEEECRNLLWLLYLSPEVLSYRQVSGRLGMPIGSIGPTRARCLEKARGHYESISKPGRHASVTGESEGRRVSRRRPAGSGKRPDGLLK